MGKIIFLISLLFLVGLLFLTACETEKGEQEEKLVEINVEAKQNYQLYLEQLNKTNEIISDYNNLVENYIGLGGRYNHLLVDYQEAKDYTWTGCRNEKDFIKICPNCKDKFNCTDSFSMLPTFGCKHTIYACTQFKRDEINIGDIVLFNYQYNKDTWIVHRIIEIRSDGGYITKGDNNFAIDLQTVYFKDILGKVFRIEI